MEALPLETHDRLERAIAVYRIWLTYQARHDPAPPCTAVLRPVEWAALFAAHHNTAQIPISVWIYGPLSAGLPNSADSWSGGTMETRGSKPSGGVIVGDRISRRWGNPASTRS